MTKSVGHKLQDDTIYLRQTRVLEHGHRDMGTMPIHFYAICLLDGTMVGQCNIFLGHDQRLLYMGNIGYGIWEDYRGHHYALHAARLLLQLAKEYGMTEVYLTTGTTNIPSIRTCELLGARKIATLEVPETDPDFKKGVRQKYRYQLDI